MLEHVKILSAIGVVRALLGAALGVVLLVKAGNLRTPDYLPRRELSRAPTAEETETMRFDEVVFRVGGAACLLIAIARLTQGIGAFCAAAWARRGGLALAAFDIANLTLFPLSTALGLYGLVVFRHPEAVEWFRRRAMR
jgi:hypothetical protein